MAIMKTLYIGLSDKDKSKQEIETATAVETIESVILLYTEYGATINTDYRGIYRYADGMRASEKTVAVMMIDVDRKTVETIADVLKDKLNQETILIVEEELKVVFR